MTPARARPRPRWRTAVIAVLALSVACFASGLLAAFALSHRWSDPVAEHVPASAGVETLELRTDDAQIVRAWLFAPEALGATVVMLHGWRGSRSTTAHRAAALAQRGHAVLTPSLRAHGDSAGTSYDFGRAAWRDVAACIDAALERRPGRPIVLVGFSYGAAVAAEAAAREGSRVDGLVLDSGFASLRDAVRNRCELFLPPVAEDLAAWGLFAAAPFVFPELDDVAPERCCALIEPGIPVLILRGGRDERVTASEADRLATAAGVRSTLVVFDDAEHDRCFESDSERWIATVSQFAAGLTRSR